MTWRWWRGRDCARCAQRHHLLLDARLIAELDSVEALLLPSLIGRIDAALNTARQCFNAILQRRAQQRCRIEFDIFVRLALQREQQADGFLDMVEAKAQARCDPALHQQLGR